MARLSLPGRVGAIVFMAFLTIWLALLTVSFVVNGLHHASALPEPARLAALAELSETADAAARRRLLTAVAASTFSARILAAPLDPPPGDAAQPIDVGPYGAALAGRAFTLELLPSERLIGWVLASDRNTVRFRIALATGETLEVTSSTPVLMARAGLPVGFVPALVGIVIALMTLVALDREFRPLSRLAAAVDTADPAAELARLPPIRARSKEVRALVGALQRLQDRIATLLRARLALVGGIQHDVRTFATRLRLRIDRIADPDERQRADTDIAHMIALLDDAMLASRAEASELDEELIELAPLVAMEAADRQAEGRPVSLTVDPPAADAAVLGDRLGLRRIVANLVDNALKYGGAAKVSVAVDGPSVVLTVDDEGTGIPKDQRDVLLEPFTRLEGSRARGTGGAGLGLAVVRRLTEAHGGALAISDAPSGGARLTVRLPRFRA